MRDQSHGRINGSAAAAFATICERRLNMASVLKSAGEFRRRVVIGGRMRRRFKIRQEIGANNFFWRRFISCSDRRRRRGTTASRHWQFDSGHRGSHESADDRKKIIDRSAFPAAVRFDAPGSRIPDAVGRRRISLLPIKAPTHAAQSTMASIKVRA